MVAPKNAQECDITVNVAFSDETWLKVKIVKIWIDPVDGSHRFEAVVPKNVVRKKTHWWQKGVVVTVD